MTRSRPAFRHFFYRVVVGSLRLLLTTSANVRVRHFAPLPTGPFILASNHISHFDPALLSGWLPPKIDWIAMSELFGTGWSRVAFTWLDVIPVARTGDDRHAIREALRRLADGHVIGVFPEGGIRDGARSMLAGAPVQDGAIMLSVRSGAPIVPTVILGSERLYNKRNWLVWRRARVFIATGDAIMPEASNARSEARTALRSRFSEAIVQLKNDLVTAFHLSPDDLPHSPQQRMAEP
jgi:1-acyl-sn-glycerol-3-phosphate acyltransferase